jgi:hypothetical protein
MKEIKKLKKRQTAVSTINNGKPQYGTRYISYTYHPAGSTKFNLEIKIKANNRWGPTVVTAKSERMNLKVEIRISPPLVSKVGRKSWLKPY